MVPLLISPPPGHNQPPILPFLVQKLPLPTLEHPPTTLRASLSAGTGSGAGRLAHAIELVWPAPMSVQDVLYVSAQS